MKDTYNTHSNIDNAECSRHYTSLKKSSCQSVNMGSYHFGYAKIFITLQIFLLSLFLLNESVTDFKIYFMGSFFRLPSFWNTFVIICIFTVTCWKHWACFYSSEKKKSNPRTRSIRSSYEDVGDASPFSPITFLRSRTFSILSSCKKCKRIN